MYEIFLACASQTINHVCQLWPIGGEHSVLPWRQRQVPCTARDIVCICVCMARLVIVRHNQLGTIFSSDTSILFRSLLSTLSLSLSLFFDWRRYRFAIDNHSHNCARTDVCLGARPCVLNFYFPNRKHTIVILLRYYCNSVCGYEVLVTMSTHAFGWEKLRDEKPQTYKEKCIWVSEWMKDVH